MIMETGSYSIKAPKALWSISQHAPRTWGCWEYLLMVLHAPRTWGSLELTYIHIDDVSRRLAIKASLVILAVGLLGGNLTFYVSMFQSNHHRNYYPST